MMTRYDLSTLEWRLSGWIPELWRLQKTAELGLAPGAEVPAIAASVPGSVQEALRRAGIIPDWNVGRNARLCEWVENRQWIYEAAIPDSWLVKGMKHRLRCEGLDYKGWILLNGKEVGEFRGSHVPHVIDLSPHIKESGNAVQIVFDTPPRWLGQFGRTSRIKDWKVRFNYMWDWTIRLVQIGIWDELRLEVTDDMAIREVDCHADVDLSDSTGSLVVKGWIESGQGSVGVSLARGGEVVRATELNATVFNLSGVDWKRLPVNLWWPNSQGGQPLYQLTVTLLDADRREIDRTERTVGFKNAQWKACQDAPAHADPWLCSVNGRGIFLRGANWVPIRPNFADVTAEQYRGLLTLYRDLGFNLLRVWGGGILEKELFYQLCDELGLMVWQEFPLSSSGVDDYPPEDGQVIRGIVAIAKSYIARRRHHVSLLLWCGGNELITTEGGAYRPVDASHPLIGELQKAVAAMDPHHRFLVTSPSGPTVHGNLGTFGHGLHWDVHGPWKPWGDLEEWRRYWTDDDALFRSELGSPGTSSAELIRKYAGDLEPLPIDCGNPLWRQPIGWWFDADKFEKERGGKPESLEEYVAWSQDRQKQALGIAIKACRERFPKCGGFIIWMGTRLLPLRFKHRHHRFRWKFKTGGSRGVRGD